MSKKLYNLNLAKERKYQLLDWLIAKEIEFKFNTYKSDKDRSVSYYFIIEKNEQSLVIRISSHPPKQYKKNHYYLHPQSKKKLAGAKRRIDRFLASVVQPAET